MPAIQNISSIYDCDVRKSLGISCGESSGTSSSSCLGCRSVFAMGMMRVTPESSKIIGSTSVFVILLMFQMMFFVSGAFCQDDALPSRERLKQIEIPNTLEPVLRDLDASNWSVRESASKRLLDPQYSQELLMAIVAQRTLSEEARSRVLGCLIERKTTAPRGALGIRMRQSARSNPGVLVNSVIPGMPAEGLLKAGDVIYEIGGEGGGAQGLRVNGLVVVVQRMAPGENIEIKLRRALRDERGNQLAGRDGRLLYDSVTVELALGSMKQFGSSGNLAFSTTVDSVRRRWSEDVIRLFAEPPRRIRVRSLDAQDDASSVAERDIKKHPDIIWMQNAVEDIPHLEPARLRQLWLKMMMRQGRLRVDAEVPSLDPEERAWRKRVYDLYVELMPSQDG